MNTNTLEHAQNEDGRAFAELVEAHYRTVYGVAFSTVGDWSAAEDIAQETFLVAWKNLPGLRKPAAFGVWLRKIARNLSRNWLRSLSYRRQLETRQRELSSAETADERSADQQAERKEQRAEIWDALRSLSPSLREVVVLYYLEGRSVREVALSLDCSPSAVKKRLERARPKLRAYFEARWEAELENERKRLQPPDAAKRFMAGVALGPVQASLGTAAAGSGLFNLWGHGLMHGELPSLIMGAAAGGLKLTGAKLAASGTCALLVGAMAVSFMHEPAPSGSDGSTAAVVAQETDDRPLVDAQTAPLEPMAPQNGGSVRQSTALVASVAPAPPLAGAASAPVRAEEKVRVTGRVVDEYGTPLPKATVTVVTGLPPAPVIKSSSSGNMPMPPINHSPDLSMVNGYAWPVEPGTADAPSYSATCDANGAFAVETAAEDGRAVVAAWTKGCMPGSVSLELVPGEDTSDVSVVLAPCITLKGTVLSAQGRPVADATVRPESQSWSGAGAMPTMAMGGRTTGKVLCSTDAQGQFSLPLARPFLLAVRVESPTHGEAMFGSIAAEPDTSITLRYPVPATARGRILQSDGTPAEGCEVILCRSNMPVFRTSDGGKSGGGGASFGGGCGVVSSIRDKTYAARVSADGTYRIERLDPNQAYLAAVADKRGVCLAQGVPLDALEPGRTLTWNYVLQSPILVRGKVYAASTGEPLAGIRVRCARAMAGMPHGMVRPKMPTTDADGRFELRVVAGPGTYEIGPVFDRFGSAYAPAPEDGFAQVLELEANRPLKLDLSLPAPHTRSFLVVDANGQPVPGCTVDVCEHSGGNSSSWRHPEVTGADGRVSLNGLAPNVMLDCSFRHEATGQCGESLRYEAGPGEVVAEETVVVSAEAQRN